MNANQLIAALQKLTPEQRELPVYIRHPAQCCCGDCFLASDDHTEVWDDPSVQQVSTGGWPTKYIYAIEL